MPQLFPLIRHSTFVFLFDYSRLAIYQGYRNYPHLNQITRLVINVHANIKIFVGRYALKNIFISELAFVRVRWRKVSSTRETGTKLLWSDFRQPCRDGTCNLKLSSKQGWYGFDARPPKQSGVILLTTNEMYSFALTFAKSNNGHMRARCVCARRPKWRYHAICRGDIEKDYWLRYYLRRSCCHLITSLVRRCRRVH